MDGAFIVKTDKKEKIKLDSNIVHADWLSTAAHAETDAELEVKTVFVAEGSTIEIKGNSSKGKAPE
jgi:predicted peroxiredoxin